MSHVPSRPSGRGLTDNHGRSVFYLRLAITDRCNLRCRYCMPAEGIAALSHGQLLSFAELERLVRIAAGLGFRKVRLTGGEPSVRRGWLGFLRRLASADIPGLASLHLTTNGVALAPVCDELAALGVHINLSLDTLDRRRFWAISRRDLFPAVQASLKRLLSLGRPFKVNTVVLADTPDKDILALANLARRHPVTVRFIERMPFTGRAWRTSGDQKGVRERLARLLPGLEPDDQTAEPSTATLFRLPGWRGKVGCIEGYARRFCHSCNKVRITPAGTLKTCLYDNGVVDLRELMRRGAGDAEIARAIEQAVGLRAANGFEAEAKATAVRPSMASIGG